MTEADLAALRELSDAATPGPWGYDSYSRIFGGVAAIVDGEPEYPEVVPFPRPTRGDVTTKQGEADAYFLAAAVNYVRAALAAADNPVPDASVAAAVAKFSEPRYSVIDLQRAYAEGVGDVFSNHDPASWAVRRSTTHPQAPGSAERTDRVNTAIERELAYVHKDELERLRRIEAAARKRERAEEVWADAETSYNESTNPTFTRTFLQLDRLQTERAEAILELREALALR